MIIALDLSWMIDSNTSGGAFHYALRLTHALVKYSNETIVAIVNPDLTDLFSDLVPCSNFKLAKLSSADRLNDIVKREKIEVIHRPLQAFENVTLSAPMINSLHDLQQFHFPEFFNDSILSYRDNFYRGSAEFSERVIVSYQHVKDDVVKFYGIAPEKIDVCPVGMVEPQPVERDLYPLVKQKYNIPDRYLFYSAGTWRHKNHIGLIKALHSLRTQYGISIALICTGYQYSDYFPEIALTISEFQLDDAVRFLGYVPDADMPLLLTNATMVVIPTLYEAGSYPLLEAMAYGVPVICSNVTSLPNSIGDSRFVFDPNNIDEMARMIAAMLQSPKLMEENIRNSSIRSQEGRWDSAVKLFLASYERAKYDFMNNKKHIYVNQVVDSYETEIKQLKQQLAVEVEEHNNLRIQVSQIKAAALTNPLSSIKKLIKYFKL